MSARTRRRVVLAMVLLGATVVGWRLVRPVGVRVATARAALAEERALLARSRALVATLADLHAARDSAVHAVIGLTPVLFGGPTSAEGRAELSILLDALARVHHVRLRNLRPLPDSSAGGLQAVGIELDAETDITGLAGFLAGLERDPRTVVVTSLAVRAAEDGTEAARSERLEVRLTLWGWLLAGRERS